MQCERMDIIARINMNSVVIGHISIDIRPTGSVSLHRRYKSSNVFDGCCDGCCFSHVVFY